MSEAQDNGLEGIAIIGMAGRFPGARDLRELWRNLREGVDCVSYFSDEELDPQPPPEVLGDPSFVKARGVLADADLFDARFFDVSPRHAELMDPQHRLFLECAHQALEDAGYDSERFPGPVGLFGGVTMSSYFIYNLMTNPELIRSAGGYQIALGSDRDYLTTLVSYKLNLRGPSLDVQTACSTSLVATVLACQSLLSYSCDLALAGGVSVKLPQKSGYFYTPGGLDSATGRCRAFDAGADGSVYGGGVGVVVLKRLEEALADGDEIRAVIRSAAMNNDGSAKVGFTAPGVEGQAEVIATAQALAGIDPETLGYVECHGSGTALGDPIEVAALTKAFRQSKPEGQRRRYCALGSVKTNLGHCSAAAGIAGLLKTVLALEHGEIPPSLHFERPNPVIDFESGPFFVADRLLPWPDGGPRRAGVSSFGLGGTNAHAVLEQAPETEPSGPSRPWQLLLLSAKSEAALEAATDNLAADLESHPDRPLADVAFTLQLGRRIFNHRRMLVCRDAEDAVRALRERDPRRLLGSYQEPGLRPVAFLFPGLGDHYLGMARGLYEAEPTFREQLDRCCDLLQPHVGIDLRGIVFAESLPAKGGLDLKAMLGRGGEQRQPSELDRTRYAQPAVFAVEHALSQLWMEWGISPEGLLGYSLGEYVAATVAGVLTLEDAVRLVAERARLIDALPAGAMLAVPLSEEVVRPLLAETGLDLAAVNAPGMCVAAGPEEAVVALQDRLAAEGTPARRLPTSHAFHSRMMEPAAQALTRLAQGFRLAPPKIPWVSNVTGTWITPAEATDPGYWARHLCQPVRFAEGLATLWKNPARVLLEVGPGFGLSTLALQQPAAEERVALPSLRNEHDGQADTAFLLGALGKLWLSGVSVDWSGFYARERRRRVPLPTYPFERARYWVEPRPFGAAAPVRAFDDTFLLPGGERVAWERALEMARAGELTVVEDSALLHRLARLRELEGLGVRVVAPALEAQGEAQAAPAPPGGRHARPNLRNPYVAPQGETEPRIAGIYQELLGIESVGVHDNFFELGGHSLLATQVVARLRDRFGVELPVGILFELPTVSGLAERVARETPATAAEAAPAAPKLRPRRRDRGVQDLLAQVASLSDAEAQELLRSKRE